MSQAFILKLKFDPYANRSFMFKERQFFTEAEQHQWKWMNLKRMSNESTTQNILMFKQRQFLTEVNEWKLNFDKP